MILAAHCDLIQSSFSTDEFRNFHYIINLFFDSAHEEVTYGMYVLSPCENSYGGTIKVTTVQGVILRFPEFFSLHCEVQFCPLLWFFEEFRSRPAPENVVWLGIGTPDTGYILT